MKIVQTTPEIELVDASNLDLCGIGCLTNKKNPGFGSKTEWLDPRWDDGLRLLMIRNEKGKPLAFLEFVPGEHAWRPVEAEGWLFIHCLWVYSAGAKIGGLGSRLIQQAIEEAKKRDVRGVAVMTSDGSWLTGKPIFLKNGFEQVATAGRFELLTFRLKDGPEPQFRDVSENAKRYPGLHLVWSAQCPLLPKSVADLQDEAKQQGHTLQVTKLSSAAEAQLAPTHYGVFALLWNGKVLADHYVSRRRFQNILKKDVEPNMS